MRVYGGSYERFLFGFEICRGDGAVRLDQVLSIPAHKSAVKCMDTAGSIVVTGGADDQLHLFNMCSNTDLGFLVNPAEGPVPCVTFVRTPESQQPTLLLSGAVNIFLVSCCGHHGAPLTCKYSWLHMMGAGCL
jgi:protein MAK11